MSRSDMRVEPDRPAPPVKSEARQDSRKGVPWYGLAIPVGAAAVFVLGTVIAGRAEPVSKPVPGVPQEAVGQHRVVLRDFPNRGWLSFYRENSDWLGEPLWGERPYDIWPSCVGFTNYVICHNPDSTAAGTVWEFAPQLLGTASLPPGQAPDPRAALSPAVQAYVARLISEGIDHWYRLGAVQSPAFCPSGKGECFQVFQLQVLRWPAGNDDPLQVRITPLGLAAKTTAR